MNNNIKLYKCYKATCSKCLNEENPYITEDEYKALLDAEGKIQCPEGHLDCGIQELKPEDYPKPPKDNKKLFLIGGGILVVLLFVAVIIFLTKNENSEKTSKLTNKSNKEQILKDSIAKVELAKAKEQKGKESISLPNEEPLRQSLLQIIDTTKSQQERVILAERVWNNYFYQECYIDNYMDKNDKHPEHWPPKDGIKYFTEHLVGFPSIIDIKILEVQRDKQTQKISGLKVQEIYNGSKFNN